MKKHLQRVVHPIPRSGKAFCQRIAMGGIYTPSEQTGKGDVYTVNLWTAFLTLAVVVPAASANAFKRLNLLNDASQRAAAAHNHGFLLGRSSFLSKMSSAVSTTDAGRP